MTRIHGKTDKAKEEERNASSFSRFRPLVAVVATALSLTHCTYEGPGILPNEAGTTGGNGGASGQGGATSNGGTSGQGGSAGTTSVGGQAGEGGATSTGGAGGSGGSSGQGGNTNTGGQGGTTSSGGSGGQAGEGGATSTGGAGGSGGGPGTVCPGVYEDSRLGLYALNTDVEVGGYDIRFVGQISGGVEYDIRCAADSNLLEDNHPFMQGVEGTVLRPQDTAISVTGMRIRITNSSSNAASSTSNVVVEPAP